MALFWIFFVGENVKIHRALSNADIQSRFIAKFEEIPQLVDTPNHTVQGFVVYKKCEHIKAIFVQPEHGVIFKNNNIWLFIDNDATIELNESIVSNRSFQHELV